jgi:hypothetical protein
MTSWEVRLATALAWLCVLPGLGCFYLAYRVSQADPSFLFAIIPIVAGFLFCAGLVLLPAAVGLAVRLQRGHKLARLQALLLGSGLAVCGLTLMAVSPLAGLGVLLYGGTLAGLMMTKAAETDLGPWKRAVEQRAPWGSTPGTKIWSSEAPQQGPWSPDPTRVPWMPWQQQSGPRTPWWQTWQAGLAQGIPLGELVLLVLALAAFVVGLATVLVPGWRLLGVVLVPVPIVVVALLEQRMRARLAGRR